MQDQYRVMECAIYPSGAYVKTRFSSQHMETAQAVFNAVQYAGPTGLVRRPEIVLMYSTKGGLSILESRVIQTREASVTDKSWRMVTVIA